MRIKALILTSLLSIMPIVSLPSWSHDMHSHHQKAQDNLTVMVNLTKYKTPSEVIAMEFAMVSLDRGNKAVIWLNSKGVRLAKVYVCPRSAKMLGAEFGKVISW